MRRLEALREGAGALVDVPVEAFGQDRALRRGEADALHVHRGQEEGDQLLLVLADAEIAGGLDPGDGVAAGIGERDQVGARALRRQELRGEIDCRKGVPDRADIAAALGGDERLGVGLELVAERVVGGDQIPFGAGLGQVVGDPGDLDIGVPHPLDDMVGLAGIAGQARGAAGEQADPVLVLQQRRDRELQRGVGHVGEDVDALPVDPFAGDRRADIGLVLVVGRDDLDLHARAFGLQAVLDRHAGGGDRALAGDVGIDAGHVGQHADLDGAVRDLGCGRQGAEQCGGKSERRGQTLHVNSSHGVFVVASGRASAPSAGRRPVI